MKITPRLPESMRCYKMHGLGNDYIYFLDTELPVGVDLSVLARVVSDRHYGIGGDGIVLVGKSDVADVSMRIWNIDGTEAQMCGNASRCVALLVRKLNLCDKDDITLSTLSGIKQLHINRDDSGHIDSVTVDMGKPIFDAERIPVDPALLKGDPAVFVAFTPNVHLPGGVLTIEWSEADNHVRLTGDATFVADMTYFPPSSKAVS